MIVKPTNGSTTMSENSTPEPVIPPIPTVPMPRPPRMGWMRRSLTFRAIVVGVLVLLLLIPLAMVHDLIRERAGRMQEAEEGISADWGGAQTITGPVIDVPYDVPVRIPLANGGFETRMEVHYAHFLPEQLNADAILEPYKKHRGIYDVAVYGSRTHLTGNFAPLTADHLEGTPQLRWQEARLVLGISDLRSIKEQVSMKVGERTVQFEPGLPNDDIVSNGLSAPFPLDPAQLDVALAFDLQGADEALVATAQRLRALLGWLAPGRRARRSADQGRGSRCRAPPTDPR